MQKKLVVGVLFLFLLLVGTGVFGYYRSKRLQPTIVTKTEEKGTLATPSTAAQDENLISDTKVKKGEKNSPRGIFLSYVNEVVRFQDSSGEDREQKIPSSRISFACIKDDNVLPNGKKFSLYDSYTNVDGLAVAKTTKIFQDEIDVKNESTSSYAGTHMVYISAETPNVIAGNLDMKVVFMGCK